MNSQPKNSKPEEKKEQKNQKSPSKKVTLFSFNKTIILTLLTAVLLIFVFNTDIPTVLHKQASSLSTSATDISQEQSIRSTKPDEINKSNPQDIRKKTKTPSALHDHSNNITYLKANASHIGAINQGLLAARISYLELLNQQNPQTANAWLKLTIQSVKQAQLSDPIENELIETISQLRSKIKDIPTIDTSSVTEELEQLHEQIRQLTSPEKVETTHPHPPSEVSTKDTEKTFWSWEGIKQYIHQALTNLYTWALSSIYIENINEAQYHTFQHTLNGNIFYSQANQLITQATIAVTYQDNRSFQYACKQLESLIRFHIQESKTQETLIQKIQAITKRPIEITPPDYLPLLQQLTHALREPMPTTIPKTPAPLPSKKIPPSTDKTLPSPASKITTPSSTDTPPISYLHIQEMIT